MPIAIALIVAASGMPLLPAQSTGLMKVIAEPTVMTNQLGGVPPPTKAVLEEMHRSEYILHARGGELTRLPVEKMLLPHDEPMNPQGGTSVDLGSDDTIYVRLVKKLCKSTDGGRTWTSQSVNGPGGYAIWQTGRWKVLRNGNFVCVSLITGKDERAAAKVWTSQDEGKSWKKLSQISLDLKMPQSGRPYDERYCHRGLDRLQDDTLLWTIDVRKTEDDRTREHALFSFLSKDGGGSWRPPSLMWDWASEGGAVLLPSEKVLATVRYQRDRQPEDSVELVKYMGAHRSAPDRPGFKNVFLMNSDDGGATWSPPRMLTTVYGQTFGSPAVQSDGTVVVIHDTRYGPGPPGSRAMISRDEGRTWEDEVYYLDSTNFTGSYSTSVVLANDTIVTIAASSVGHTWETVKNQTDLYAIRWKPRKD
jgi:hypothetical protein